MSLYELTRRFDYYAQPEGCDPLNKVLGVTKYGLLGGFIVGFHDVFLKSRTSSVMDTVRCFGFWMVPMAGMGAAFASTTYIATNLRGKDDPLNYVLGAISAGGVLHGWHKCGLTTLYSTILLSIIAAAKKDSIESGWSFLGKIPEQRNPGVHLYLFGKPEPKYERGWVKE